MLVFESVFSLELPPWKKNEFLLQYYIVATLTPEEKSDNFIL